MDSKLIKWLSQMPKNYSLSGSKTSFYNGEKQLKLFLKINHDEDLSKTIQKCKDFVGESIPVVDEKGRIIGIFSEEAARICSTKLFF